MALSWNIIHLIAYSSTITIGEGILGRFGQGKNLTLKRSSLNVTGSENRPVYLKSHGGGASKEYWKGINVNNGSDLDMNWTEVSGAIQALDISNTGTRSIKNSMFYNNYQNVNCYNATVNMFNNYFTDAIHGISAFHFSSPMLNHTLNLQNGLNEIAGNNIGVFSDSSMPQLQDGHNNLKNRYYNLHMQNMNIHSTPISAENNWWGSDDYDEVKQSINSSSVVDFLPYDFRPNQTIIRENQVPSDFINGYAYMLNGDYGDAIYHFNLVLEDSMLNDNDIVTLYALFECHKLINELSILESQLDQYIANPDYAPVHKPMKNVRALIYRETERFAQAIGHYEDVLQNNPSFQDSCYAVIDLGDTYFESNGGSRSQMTELIPVSLTQHQQNRGMLLNSIFQMNETENYPITTPSLQLLGNYPNPFNPATTISFHLKTESNVKIEVFNIRGQKVTTLINEKRPSGLNTAVWNGKDRRNTFVASGVYFYQIASNGTSKTAKMLLMK